MGNIIIFYDPNIVPSDFANFQQVCYVTTFPKKEKAKLHLNSDLQFEICTSFVETLQ